MVPLGLVRVEVHVQLAHLVRLIRAQWLRFNFLMPIVVFPDFQPFA